MSRLAFRLAATLLPLLPAAALAASATTTQNLNVRSGPATTYGVVAQLHLGDTVDVRQCEGLFCQVNFGTQTGWVSATYLTRDSVPKPPAAAPAPPQIASTAGTTLPPVTTTSSSTLPPLTTAATKPSAVGTPTKAPAQIASVAPGTANTTPPLSLPPGSFPPAYDDTAAAPASGDANADSGGDGGASAGTDMFSADNGDAQSSVDLPDGGGDVIASNDDPGVPRPKADVPGGLRSGPDDEVAGADATAPDAAAPSDDGGIEAPVPSDDWQYGSGPGNHFGRLGWRGRLAEVAARPAQVCFFGDSSFGGDGFCLRQGQSVADLGGWSSRITALRNPRGLRVTVCSADGPGDCRVYVRSGPLLPGDAGIASITVDSGGY